MVSAISTAKITPPRLPQIVERPRLLERLEQNRRKKLTLILGQAAQGKSTLAASYIRQSSIPTAWVNLQKQDSDPVNLFFSIAHALHHALKGMNLLPLLNYPAVSLGPRLEKPLYHEWIMAIFDSVSAPVQMVLDGLNNLAPGAPSFGFLQVMLDELPRPYHLIMLSRHTPPIKIEDLTVKREAHVLTNSDLAFTPKEIKAFFKDMKGMAFTPDQLKRIHAFTEGWVGGLILLSETLDRLPEEDRDTYVSQDLPGQFRAEVFQYFGEEVLASQPEVMQRFLIKSSIFDTVDPEFMKEITAFEDAEAVLRESARKNLFVEARYKKEKGWVFHYHPLFRDFLKTKFRSVVNKEERRRLFIRAGRVHEDRGEIEQAIRYYQDAKAYKEAASLLRRTGMVLLISGRRFDLANLLMKFPEEMLKQDPWLLFYFSMTKRFTETSKNILRLKDAFASFEKQEDIGGQLLTLAFMIEASIFGGHDIIPIVSLLRKSDALLNSLSSDQYAFEKSILYFQTGLGHCLRGGNLKRSFETSQNAYRISRGFGNIVLQVSALANELLALSFFGDFSRAKDLCEEIKGLLSSCQYEEIHLLYRINWSAYLINAGELDRAKSLIESIKKDAEKYGLTYCNPVIQIYDLILRPHLEEYREAEAIAKDLLELVTALDNLFLKGAALMYLGVSHYCKGDFQSAENCLDRSREILRSDRAYSASHLIVNRIVKVLVSIHERKYETADKELKALFEINRELGSDLVAFHIHLASALLNRQKKNPEEVIFHLIHGFKIAKTNGYYHTVWMRREDFACVTYLVIELNVGEVKQYAIDLLTFHLASYGESETERLMRHPNENVRQSARLIRETIHRSKVPRVKINFLGGFGVYIVGGQEVKWEGFQAKTLLKSLIVHGSRGVATDLVMEDVWPESASNDRKFKVALHRLRKTLEPGMKKAFGSSYIHLKGGKLYLDHELVDLDVERFVTLIHKGKHHEGEGRMAQALTCYQEAVDLYRGDFLPEDRHTSWVENKQNELKNQFLDLLLRTARIHETRGSFRKATALYKKALQTDPLLEEACQRVMRLLSEQGKRSEALRVYEQFKTAVRRELGTHPDPLTDSIHRKIMA